MKKHTVLTSIISSLIAVSSLASAAQAIPTLKPDPKLQAMLPKDIRDSGEITAVLNGSFPPYTIVESSTKFKGASVDFDTAIGQLLGVKMKHKSVSGLSSVLMGIKSGRYTYSSGPIGDFASREGGVDFVDFVQEYVVFAVKKGNPHHINGLATTCGLRVSVMAGGSAERVIKSQSAKCTAAGKSAIKVLSYTDQPTSILAVKSNRADAFFSSQAPLSYFVKQSNGALELTGTGKSNGFDTLYQGALVPKGSKLAETLKAAYEELHRNGTYDAIMQKWGLTGNALKAPGINLATTKNKS